MSDKLQIFEMRRDERRGLGSIAGKLGVLVYAMIEIPISCQMQVIPIDNEGETRIRAIFCFMMDLPQGLWNVHRGSQVSFVYNLPHLPPHFSFLTPPHKKKKVFSLATNKQPSTCPLLQDYE